MLQARGVKNIAALRGGWNEWVSAGNPVVTGK
jgi:3-mercaptopyruvate sulfurtransferase SseA